ncbi:hypothetical protein [Aureispira sp. CCB-E]|uniref:hypothetical protein n=1 Tax=Aureispira sp. CCB-E TaxID=3051121 RepID=UPI0028690D4F|nr:hypothetical protein [Aureispira sp. CCB-E]WMX16131.1 hypothetical protein QP953_07105 [Aureispira sp. CCB-E]
MTEETLMDDQSLDVDLYEEVQQKNKKYTKWLIFLSILNTILFPLVTVETSMPTKERFWTGLSSIFISFPLIFLLLGLVLAFIPYKNFETLHKKKRRSFLKIR